MRTSAAYLLAIILPAAPSYLLAIILPAAPLVAAVACHPGRTYCALELLGQGYTDADTLTRYAQHAGHRAEPTCNSLWVCEEDYSFRFIIECPKICWPGTHGAYCKEDWQYSSAG